MFKSFFVPLISFSSQPLTRAVAVLCSTIIGAGVLGIPYLFARVGAVVGLLYVLGMGALMLGVHLAVAELAIRTKMRAQLSGLVRRYCGASASYAMAVVFLFLHWGALVAYLIGEGESLSALFGGPSLGWTLVFFCVAVALILRGSTFVAKFDAHIVWGTVLMILIISLYAALHARVMPLVPESGASLWIPFGVFLFALHGTSAIAELEVVVHQNPSLLRRAVVWGTLIPLTLYTIFALAVISVTGTATTSVATIGLGESLGPAMRIAGNTFAAIAMLASFVTIGHTMRRAFQWDYGFSARGAALLALGVPLVVYAVGAREFILVIGTVGASAGTIEIILIACALWRSAPIKKNI